MSEFEYVCNQMIKGQQKKIRRFYDEPEVFSFCGEAGFRLLYRDEMEITLDKLQKLLYLCRKENNFPDCTCCHPEEEDDLK